MARWKKIALWSLAGLLLLFLFLEIFLAPIVKWQVNRQLASLPDHKGACKDVDIKLWKGEVALNQMWLEQKHSPKNLPVFSAKQLGMTVAWRALLNGKIEMKLKVVKPTVLYIHGVTEPSGRPMEVKKAEVKNWRDAIEELMPIDIREIRVTDGKIRFKFPQEGSEAKELAEEKKEGKDMKADEDQGKKKEIDLTVTDIEILAKNLTNRPKSGEEYMASAYATAKLPGNGEMVLKLRFDPLKKSPALDMDAKINHVNLVAYNKLFKEYAKFDLEKGRFDLAAETQTKNDYVKGYVKPLFTDIDVVGEKDKKDNPFQKLWEGIVGAGAKLLKNPPKDRMAARIPFEGRLENPDVDTWGAVVSALRNAIGKAITPSIEERIN
jgi:hypothetical protein